MDDVVNTTQTEQPINYEAEYKKAIAERDNLRLEVDKQKGLKDKYASENAEYKRKAEAQMSEEEKKAKEWQEIIDSNAKMKAELAQMQLEKELLANGFTAEESNKLIKGNFAVKDIATIIKERVDLALKSENAKLTKTSTPQSLMGNGANNNTELSFIKRIASLNNNDVMAEEIKKHYS